MITLPVNKNTHFKLTDAATPAVMETKYTVSSNGDLTGFRNLTMDKAPTIPSDKAISPEISVVRT